MTGTKSNPHDEESKYIIHLMKEFDVEFKDVDLAGDVFLQETLMSFSNCPTWPQVYVKGKFVGDLHMVKKMYEDGRFSYLLIEQGIVESPFDESK